MLRYDGTYNSEFEEYYQNNVDPTARPLAINVDYSYALTKCYHELTDVLSGKKEPEDLDLLEYSYYRSCKAIWITQIALRKRSGRHTHPESQPALCWRMQKQIRLNHFILMRQKPWAHSGGSCAKWKRNITFRSSQESATLMHLMNLSPNGMKMEARLSRRKSGRLYVNRYPARQTLLCGLFFLQMVRYNNKSWYQ